MHCRFPGDIRRLALVILSRHEMFGDQTLHYQTFYRLEALSWSINFYRIVQYPSYRKMEGNRKLTRVEFEPTADNLAGSNQKQTHAAKFWLL